MPDMPKKKKSTGHVILFKCRIQFIQYPLTMAASVLVKKELHNLIYLLKNLIPNLNNIA